MTFAIGDRILETTTTTGVGTITLAGAVSGYRAFSSVATTNGDIFYYQISGGTEWEVGLGTRASATTFTRTQVYASSNAGALVNFSAGTKEVWMDSPAEALRWAVNKSVHPNVHNGSLLVSVSAGAVTFALRNAAGNVPSAADPVFLTMQNGSGSMLSLRVTAALSITIASGATMGGVNATPLRIWFGVLVSGGNPEMFVRNCTIQFGLNSGNAVKGFPTGLISTTAQAGAADDAAQVTYSAVARTNVPFMILGYADWDDTVLATAGNYATGPNKVIMGDSPLPGSIRSTQTSSTSTAASSAGAPVAALSAVYAPTSKCNSVEVKCLGGSLFTNASGGVGRLYLFNNSVPAQLDFCDLQQNSGANWNLSAPVSLFGLDYPGTTANQTYQVQVALPAGGGVATWPAATSIGYLIVKEIMG